MMPVSVEKNVLGKLSACLKHALRAFFAEDTFNFKVGMRIPTKSHEYWMLIVKLGAYIVDMKAHHHRFCRIFSEEQPRIWDVNHAVYTSTNGNKRNSHIK